MYLGHLLECKKLFGFKLYDIVCMSNHVHELYQVPKDVTIAQILQRAKGHFSQKFNKKFGRKGHFWRNKPFYRIVEDESYAYNTMTYFHDNPVKAGMVANAADWPYSGYRFHILGERNGLLGQLLDPLPDQENLAVNQKRIQTIQKVFKSSKMRFVGSPNFREAMRKQFGNSQSPP